MREHPAPSSLNLTTPVLNKRRRPGLPEYTTPLPSPAIGTVPTSPALAHSRTISAPPSSITITTTTTIPHLTLTSNSPSLQQQSQQASPSLRVMAPKVYDSSRVADMVAAMSQELLGTSSYAARENGWWQLLKLPSGLQSLQMHIMSPEPIIIGRSSRHPSFGLTLPGLPSPSSLSVLGSRLSPGPKKR